jgi:hypothetical protein
MRNVVDMAVGFHAKEAMPGIIMRVIKCDELRALKERNKKLEIIK